MNRPGAIDAWKFRSALDKLRSVIQKLYACVLLESYRTMISFVRFRETLQVKLNIFTFWASLLSEHIDFHLIFIIRCLLSAQA